jgi:hypothetical protein
MTLRDSLTRILSVGCVLCMLTGHAAPFVTPAAASDREDSDDRRDRGSEDRPERDRENRTDRGGDKRDDRGNRGREDRPSAKPDDDDDDATSPASAMRLSTPAPDNPAATLPSTTSLIGAISVPPSAAPPPTLNHDSDQDRAREAVKNGSVYPLAKVLPLVLGSVDGPVVDVNLQEKSAGLWIYEILVVDSDGLYKEFTIDAKRNELLDVRTR